MNTPAASDSSIGPRRRFLAAATTGAISLAAGLASFQRSVRGRPTPGGGAATGKLSVLSKTTISAGETIDLRLRFRPNVSLKPGARLWLFYDVRQGAAWGQVDDPSKDAFVTVATGGEEPAQRIENDGLTVQGALSEGIPRTLDLYPTAPEFLNLIEIGLKSGLAAGKSLDVNIRRWQGPQTPIASFRFWMVVDADAEWDFVPVGFRRYRKFVRRGTEQRIETGELLERLVTADLSVQGEFAPVPADNVRRTPGVYWGELHGMAFNQRPLDDFYNYAKRVSRLDFCCPCLFSYNTCLGDTWQRIKDAARRHAQAGRFVPFVGFECGTVPDGSHRCAYFRDPEGVPPIFCENRPPTRDPAFRKRLHPDTIVCRTLDEFYATVARYGGIVTGHHHTLSYDREHLAEMWQKQRYRTDHEEARVIELLRKGRRFGLVGGSDTHDSMPGNPWPEPHCPSPAGFMAVHADQLTLDALWESILKRRVYATSGARIVMRFQSGDHPMGSELPLDAPRRFVVEVDGARELQSVELLRNGTPIAKWSPADGRFSEAVSDLETDVSQPAFYLVRATQTDLHRGWTSPIWFG